MVVAIMLSQINPCIDQSLQQYFYRSIRNWWASYSACNNTCTDQSLQQYFYTSISTCCVMWQTSCQLSSLLHDFFLVPISSWVDLEAKVTVFLFSISPITKWSYDHLVCLPVTVATMDPDDYIHLYSLGDAVAQQLACVSAGSEVNS